MPRFKAVVVIVSGRVIYQGKNDLKAAVALDPGTYVGYSDDSEEAAVANARAASFRLMNHQGASGGRRCEEGMTPQHGRTGGRMHDADGRYFPSEN
jgi:hypothetical protein